MTIIITSSDKTDGHSTPLMLNGKLGYWLNSKDADKLSEYVTNYKKAYFTPDEEEFKEIDRISRILDSIASFSDVLEGMRPDPLKWNDGYPPYVGWWNASAGKSKTVFRWFDGSAWGAPCYESYRSDVAAIFASHKCNDARIQWRWHYPENARVKRIDSRTGKVCRITHPGL